MPTATAESIYEKYSLRAPRGYKNYINGEWVASASGKTFDDVNPANSDDHIGTFQESNADDVRAAVDAADRAYKKWRLVPAPKRAEYLYRVAAILQRDKEKIAREMTREMGKVLEETKGDVQEAIDLAYLMAGEGRRLFGVTTPSELPNKFNMAVRMPLGGAVGRQHGRHQAGVADAALRDHARRGVRRGGAAEGRVQRGDRRRARSRRAAARPRAA